MAAWLEFTLQNQLLSNFSLPTLRWVLWNIHIEGGVENALMPVGTCSLTESWYGQKYTKHHIQKYRSCALGNEMVKIFFFCMTHQGNLFSEVIIKLYVCMCVSLGSPRSSPCYYVRKSSTNLVLGGAGGNTCRLAEK